MTIRIAVADLASLTPYSQSRYHITPKADKETADDYEKRTWRQKAYTDTKGMIQIPPMAFKAGLDDAAAKYSERIPGKGVATYSKHFKGGIQVIAPVPLNVNVADLEEHWYHCHANGQRGSATRVMRCFPEISEWKAKVEFTILDPVIATDVFERALHNFGTFIGIGRFRPQNGGHFGRFAVNNIDWQKIGVQTNG